MLVTTSYKVPPKQKSISADQKSNNLEKKAESPAQEAEEGQESQEVPVILDKSPMQCGRFHIPLKH